MTPKQIIRNERCFQIPNVLKWLVKQTPDGGKFVIPKRILLRADEQRLHLIPESPCFAMTQSNPARHRSQSTPRLQFSVDISRASLPQQGPDTDSVRLNNATGMEGWEVNCCPSTEKDQVWHPQGNGGRTVGCRRWVTVVSFTLQPCWSLGYTGRVTEIPYKQVW